MENPSDSGLHIRPLPRLGQELGRFLIEKELPRGGQARVYRAWQTDLQRPVALKLLPNSYAADQDAAARFKREIENVARISHPNIVRVYEAGDIDGHPFFTMEFLEGQDAESMVKRGAIAPDEAASIIEAVARAVHEAHGAGIVHRDIKPGNIILRKDDTPVLTDFGLAQDLTHTDQLTRTGISMGTPAYMAPEQARGERNRVGKRSDIYALGATLFSMLTAKRPVEGESAYELMVKVAESTGPKWPRQAIDDVPPDLRAIVEMAMQNDPGKRYESAADFADDLERYLHGEWVVARTRSPLAKLWVRSRRFAPVAAVVVITLALAAGMVYTGLNPVATDNREGLILDETPLMSEFDAVGEDIETLFDEGAWTRQNATVRRGASGELVLERSEPGPVLISPRKSACWGDFSLQTEFRVDDSDGELALLIGLPDDVDLANTAYSVVFGARSRDRVELRRLGVGVYSTYLGNPDGRVLSDGAWYRAVVRRSGQTLEVGLFSLPALAPVVSFTYEDDFPALVSGMKDGESFARKRFGMSASADTLRIRDVTVSHRDNPHSMEALLFSLGEFGELEDRISARLTNPLGNQPGAQARNERAELLHLRARCRAAMQRDEEALADCSEAKNLITDSDLRGRVFLLSASLEARRGDDIAALAQYRVALFNGPVGGGFASRVYHQVYTQALRLPPERALAYFDFVGANALGSPWLVCDSLYRSAGLRLAADDREQGIAALERIEGENYRRFGAAFTPAMVRLFELRWEVLAGDDSVLAPLTEVADWLAGSVGGYGVDNRLLITPLVRACWAGRMGSGPGDMALWRRAGMWLESVEAAGADAVWVELLRALMNEERPEGLGEARIMAWRELAARLKTDDPRYGVLSAVAEYFIGAPVDEADLKRRNDILRRALRKELVEVPAFWLGDAGPDRLADYCIAMVEDNFDREAAVTRLENAAAAPNAGVIRLLKGRASAWLPIPG
ncbi:MAG: serine/threonine protein kinase [Planctomycetes bacterium]|nr:serine/threonine protein kinase [Planctomycetota bacterium]